MEFTAKSLQDLDNDEMEETARGIAAYVNGQTFSVKFIKSTDMSSTPKSKWFKTEAACLAWANKHLDLGNIEVIGYDF